jgi:hypothetical protein
MFWVSEFQGTDQSQALAYVDYLHYALGSQLHSASGESPPLFRKPYELFEIGVRR